MLNTSIGTETKYIDRKPDERQINIGIYPYKSLRNEYDSNVLVSAGASTGGSQTTVVGEDPTLLTTVSNIADFGTSHLKINSDAEYALLNT